jgi:hypothetical protein
MPKLLFARPPLDAQEERQARRLAGSRHAPGDWILRAHMIARSWAGERTTHIAAALGCHLRPCASGCFASTQRALTAWETARAWGASRG